MIVLPENLQSSWS